MSGGLLEAREDGGSQRAESKSPGGGRREERGEQDRMWRAEERA